MEQNDSSLQDIRLLLVEDDLLTMEVYQIFLPMHGVSLKTAKSVAEAFKILAEWVPDIIVSDIGLPGEDGYSFIKRVRQDSRLSNIYAIAVTGYSNDRKALEAGYQESLSKPLDPQDLVKRIQVFAERQKEQS